MTVAPTIAIIDPSAAWHGTPASINAAARPKQRVRASICPTSALGPFSLARWLCGGSRLRFVGGFGLMRSFDDCVSVSPAVPGRRQKEARFRKALPQCFILERNCPTAALSLRDHAIDVANTNPVGMQCDAPFGVVMGFGPGPMGSERTQIYVLYVIGFVDAVSVRHGRDRPADPGLNVHVFLESRPHQTVPKVLVPFAVLGDHLEWHTATRLEIDHIGIAFGMRLQRLHQHEEWIGLGQICRAAKVG